jgi:SAM-dependent methyltransferase
MNPAQEAVKTHGKVWIGSPTDVRTGQEAEDALKTESDKQYWVEGDGITKVDEQRWKRAQEFELATWASNPQLRDDRNNEHAVYFNNYEVLPPDLGSVIEFGCGPFTQLKTILEKDHTANRVTLLDPLLNEYLKHPGCTYKNRKFQDLPTETIAAKAEDVEIQEEFDTAVCINVLEHVQDALSMLGAITQSLKIGGTLVFVDRFYDNLEIDKCYDVGHPIRVMKGMLEAFYSNFEPLFSKEQPGDAWYFIGRRKA